MVLAQQSPEGLLSQSLCPHLQISICFNRKTNKTEDLLDKLLSCSKSLLSHAALVGAVTVEEPQIHAHFWKYCL